MRDSHLLATKGHQEGKPRIPERQQCPHPGPRTRRHFPSVPGSVGSMPRKCQGLGLGRAHARVPGRQPRAHGCSHTPSPAEQEPQCCCLQSTEWHLLRRFSRLFLARNSSLAWAAHPTPTEGSLTRPALVGHKRSDQRVLSVCLLSHRWLLRAGQVQPQQTRSRKSHAESCLG